MAEGGHLTPTDVAVVGAGPGGAAAAIACAGAGLEVTLLDRSRLPRPRPGETLHPGVEAPLRQLGVLERVEQAGFVRHPGVEVTWDGPPRLEAYGADAGGPWLGYQAERGRFDALLVERARELGVTVREGCRALAPIVTGDRVAGVQTPEGPVPARYVVDAAGGGHWLARGLGLALDRRSPRLLARYGYLAGSWPERDAAPAIVADGDGWTWTARVQDGVYNWTRLDVAGAGDAARAGPPRLDGLAPHGPSRSADVSWRAVPACAGPGYAIVGDAAIVMDPASSHGVLRALLMGMHAARLVAAVLAQPHAERRLSADYAGFAVDWFERDVAALHELYRRLPAPPPWLPAAAAAPSPAR